MIAIIDVDSLMFVIGNGNKLLDENYQPVKDETGKFVYTEKTEEELIAAADWAMNDVLYCSGADGYIAYIKGRHTTDVRKSINPEYKANRPKESPKWWSFVKQYLIEKWKVIPADNYEVDDYVNVVHKMLPDSFISAIDKDLLGLEGRHFNWKKKEWVEVTKEQEDYNFWASMITGDTADNIKGIPKKGEKFAELLHKECTECNTSQFHETILTNYMKYFGESEGIKQFYQNYFALKIVDNIPGFVVPEIVKYSGVIEQKDDEIKF